MSSVDTSYGPVLYFKRGGPVCAFCGRRVPPMVVHSCRQDEQYFEVRLMRWPTRADRPTKWWNENWSWIDYAYLDRPRSEAKV